MAKGMNPQAMLKQAQKMQADMEALQEDLDAREYEIAVGGGVVGVKINGKKEILALTIQPEAVDPEDVEMLQDMIVAAVNEGIADAQAMVEERMSAVTGGMNIPGLF